MICFITAFLAEARPLIQKYKFEQIQSSSLPIYQSEIGYLGISGMGKKSAAEAVSHLARLAPADSIWINVGIAGHRNSAVGTPFLAHKIVDLKTGKNWYPQILFQPVCGTATVFTANRCENKYREGALYEMEASSFYEEAMRVSTVELIHSFKVVSDNAVSPAKKVSPKIAETLIRKNLNTLDQVISELTAIRKELPVSEPALMKWFLERWHFTVTEQYQLKRKLLKLQVLNPSGDLSATILGGRFRGNDKAKEVLNYLEHQIETLPVYL